MGKPSKKILKSSIDILNIGPTVTNRLADFGIATVADLCKQDLKSLKFLGTPAQAKIIASLKMYNLETNSDYLESQGFSAPTVKNISKIYISNEEIISKLTTISNDIESLHSLFARLLEDQMEAIEDLTLVVEQIRLQKS